MPECFLMECFAFAPNGMGMAGNHVGRSPWCWRKSIYRCLWKCQFVIYMLSFWYVACLCRSGEKKEKEATHGLHLSVGMIPWTALLVLVLLPPGWYHIIICQLFLFLQPPNTECSTRLAYFRGHLSSWRAAYKYDFPLCWVRYWSVFSM